MNKIKEYSFLGVLKSIRRLFNYDKKHTILSILGAVITAVPVYIIWLLNGFLMRTATERAANKTTMWDAVFIFIIVLILTRLPIILGYRISSWASYKASSYIKKMMVKAWISQDEKHAKDRHTGSVMNRIINDGELISDFLFQGAGVNIIEPFITGFFGFVTVITIDFEIAVFLLVTGALSGAFSIILSRFIHKLMQNNAEKNETVACKMSDILSGAFTIRMLGIRENIFTRYEKTTTEHSKIYIRTELINKLSSLFSQLFEVFGLVGCLTIALWMTKKGSFYLPNIMIVISMQPLVTGMLARVGTSWNVLTGISVPSDRINELLTITKEDKREDKPNLNIKSAAPLLEFNQVYFSYANEKPVLDGISFKINKGEKVAVIGNSGVGKTTLLGLILGYFIPSKGDIRLFGESIENCSLSSWRMHMTLVQQENPMLNMSIADNIAIALDYEISRNEIIEAAKKAGAHEFIEKLHDGYDTLTGEGGVALSGGQRQRVAIARAFLSNAPLILLDEPTSALDIESEKIITESIRHLPSDYTVLAIAHRLTTICDFDHIIVLDKGRIIEYGRHEELIMIDGIYAKLWKLNSLS